MTLKSDQRAQVRLRMVILAKAFSDLLQVRERKGTQNRGEVVDAIIRLADGTPGEPWCCDFVQVLYEAACAAFALLPEFEIGRSCGRLARVASELGRLHEDEALVHGGDLLLIDLDRDGDWDHVELAISGVNRDSGKLATIGANTSAGPGGSQAEGDGIYRRTRDTRKLRCAFVSL